MEKCYDTIIGVSTRQDWPAWAMTLNEPQSPDGPRAAVEAIVRGEDTKHRIVTFLWNGWVVLIGELRFDCGRQAFEAAQRACRRYREAGRAYSEPCQGGFLYKFCEGGR